MHKTMGLLAIAVVLAAAGVSVRAGDKPRVLRDDLTLTLVAEQPEIVTPVAMAVDARGRLLVVESHTHFRPADYDGPPHDRIRVIHDDDGDGRADRFTTFYDQSDMTMGLALGPDGFVYVATRAALFKLRDTDGDGVADQRIDLAHLETEGNYPHNGLSGLAFDDAGHVFVGVGENLGKPYTLVGSDGKTYDFRGEGGNVYRFDLEGKNLTHFAGGFWNPFELTMASHGRLFVIDNDPDASPPCRLIHTVEGGDYGYSFRYGRSGLHPLQAWDGELPGTLPMVSGTGEAPTGMVYYDRPNMPADLVGQLIVTSWGDHRIEAFQLLPHGASFKAKLTPLVLGGNDFRPTGMTIGPDGAIYFADWVDRSYKLHGKGRIWKLSSDVKLNADQTKDPVPMTDPERRAANLSPNHLDDALAGNDPFLRHAAIMTLSRQPNIASQNPKKLHNLLAQKIAGVDPKSVIPEALKTSDPDVRLAAVRWLADEDLKALRPNLITAMQDDTVLTPQLFEAYLATLEWLDTGKVTGKGASVDRYVIERLRQTPAGAAQAMALRVLDPNHNVVTLDLLRRFIESGHNALQLEAVRTAAVRDDAACFALLKEVATNTKLTPQLRAEAVVGLAAEVDAHLDVLNQLAKSDVSVVAAEAKRALRDAPAQPVVTTDVDTLLEQIGEGGDVEAGRRIFFHPKLADCDRCHRIHGRGGAVGPDLSVVGKRATRRWLIESIVQPSWEVAPQFVSQLLVMNDGSSHLGIMLPQPGQGGHQRFIDAAGKTFSIKTDDLAQRQYMDISMMPPGLAATMTVDELRDLVAYLMQLK